MSRKGGCGLCVGADLGLNAEGPTDVWRFLRLQLPTPAQVVVVVVVVVVCVCLCEGGIESLDGQGQ